MPVADAPGASARRDRRRRWFLLVALLAGLVLLGAGAYLLLSGSTPDEHPATAL